MLTNNCNNPVMWKYFTILSLLSREFFLSFFIVIWTEGTTIESPFDLATHPGAENISVADHGSVVACVVNTWAYYRHHEGSYNITKDEADIGHLCTHILYRPLSISGKLQEISFNLHLDVKMNYFADVVAMKSKYHHLKIIPSVGGWSLSSSVWSAIANSSENRSQFINSSMNFLREKNCSGLNLDWTYPKESEKSAFTSLAKAMQDEFQKEGFILTTTIWARISQLETSYEISEITRVFDLVFIKFVDLHTNYRKTGHNSPLYSEYDNNAQNILEYLIKKRANPDKLVFGVPFFGHSYMLKNRSSIFRNAGLKEPSRVDEVPPPWNRDSRFTWGYNEICYSNFKEKELRWKTYWDDFAKVPISLNSKGEWMTFENVRSIYEKVKFAKRFGLRGIMAWTLDMDDFRGLCGVNYPLLRTINYALNATSSSATALCSFVDSQNDGNLYSPVVTTNVYNYSVIPNSSVEVKCTVEGYPLPRIQIVKDRKSVSTNMQKILSSIECPPFNKIQVVTMEISNFSKENAGLYVCEAENEYGNARRKFHLRENTLEYKITSIETQSYSTWLWIAFGGLSALFCLAVIIGILVYKRIVISKNGMTKEEIRAFLEGRRKDSSAEQHEYALPESLPYDKTYELSFKQYSIDKECILGSGAFGIVYKGRVDDTDVAVKSIKPGADKQYLISLLSELKILIYLGRHENMVNLVGASTPHLKLGMVYMFVELCSLGNLIDFLRQCRKTFVHNLSNENAKHGSIINAAKDGSGNGHPSESIETVNLYMWSIQIAKALQHLHSKKVIHGDLAARNILVFERNIVKLTDFGLSKKLYEYGNYVKKTSEPLPWRWMAIESLRDLEFSFKTDVWAYGITVWEIFSLGETPYPGLTWTTEFVDSLSNNLRVHKPKYVSTALYNIMLTCWNVNPDDRPQPQKIIEDTSDILNRLTGSEYEDLSKE